MPHFCRFLQLLWPALTPDRQVPLAWWVRRPVYSTGRCQQFSGPMRFVWGVVSVRCPQYFRVDLLGHMLVWPSVEGRSVACLVPYSVTYGLLMGRIWAYTNKPFCLFSPTSGWLPIFLILSNLWSWGTIFVGHFWGAPHLACLCTSPWNHPPQGLKRCCGRCVSIGQGCGALVHNQIFPYVFPRGSWWFFLTASGWALPFESRHIFICFPQWRTDHIDQLFVEVLEIK